MKRHVIDEAHRAWERRAEHVGPLSWLGFEFARVRAEERDRISGAVMRGDLGTDAITIGRAIACGEHDPETGGKES